MATLPAVEIICEKYPLIKREIKEVSRKFEQRWSRWPTGGTFDKVLCEEMEVLLSGYKEGKRTQKAKDKRAKEKIILDLFKGGEAKCRLDSTQTRRPPPPLPPTHTGHEGQLPVLSGTLEFSGEIDIADESEGEQQHENLGLRRKEKRRAKKPDKEPAPASYVDCYHDMKKIRDKEKIESDRSLRFFLAGQKEEERLERSRKDRKCIPPQRQGSVDPPFTQDSGDNTEDEEDYNDTRGKVEGDEEEEEESVGGLAVTQKHDTRTSPEAGPSGITIRRKKEKKAKYQAPVLVKGGDICYKPWGWMDMDSMIQALPDITGGASKWIKVLEQHTIGKLLAVGDITALLARVLGQDKLRSVLERGGLVFLLRGVDFDGVLFDTYRRETWSALKQEYPAKVDPKALQGRAIREDEHPAVYLREQVAKWRTETERDPETDTILSMWFRTSVMDGLPSSVKTKLEDVVGLKTSRSHEQFSDYLVHMMDRYRRDEKKISDQNKDVQRKLSQLQLHGLAKDQEKKKQEGGADSTMMVQLEQQHAPPVYYTMQATAPMNLGTPALQPPLLSPQPGAQVSPNGPPMVNVYQSTGPPPNYYNKQAMGGGKIGHRRYPPRRKVINREGPQLCWGCKQPGHIRAECQPDQLSFAPRRKVVNRGEPILCWRCNQQGHTRAQCQTNPPHYASTSVCQHNTYPQNNTQRQGQSY